MSKLKKDKDGNEQVKETALFLANMAARIPPRIQIGAYAVLLSSTIASSIKPEDREELFDELVKNMRHQIKQVGIKDRKVEDNG